MSEPMWAGGPQQFQDRYPDVWAVLPSFMREPFYPQSPPLSPLAMSGVCLLMSQVSIYGAYGGWAFGQYQIYYGDAYRATPPGSYTDTVPTVTVPTPFEPPTVGGPNYDYTLGQINAGILTILDYLGVWVPPDNLHVQIQAILDGLEGAGSGNPTSSKHDVARILAAIYYTAAQPIAITNQYDDSAVLSALAAARTSLEGGHTAISGSLVAVASDLTAHDTQMDTDHGAILSAIGDIPTTGGGTDSRFPGLSAVTLSSPVAFSGPLQITQAMDGCIVDVTGVPAGTGRQEVGGFVNWQHMGWLAFVASDTLGDELQFLNLDGAVYVPKRIANPVGLVLFPRIGSSGTVTPWTFAS